MTLQPWVVGLIVFVAAIVGAVVTWLWAKWYGWGIFKKREPDSSEIGQSDRLAEGVFESPPITEQERDEPRGRDELLRIVADTREQCAALSQRLAALDLRLLKLEAVPVYKVPAMKRLEELERQHNLMLQKILATDNHRVMSRLDEVDNLMAQNAKTWQQGLAAVLFRINRLEVERPAIASLDDLALIRTCGQMTTFMERMTKKFGLEEAEGPKAP